MKKTLLWLVFTLLTGGAVAELRIAIVNPEAAMGKSQAYMRASMEAEEDLNDETEKAKSLQADLQAIEQRMQKEGLTMSNEKRLKLQQEGEAKAVELQNLIKLVQKQSGERQKLLLNELIPVTQEAINLVRKEKNFDVVLHAQAVLSLGENVDIDITEAVTEKINSLKK